MNNTFYRADEPDAVTEELPVSVVDGDEAISHEVADDTVSYPWVGIISTVMATVLAGMQVPDDYRPPGALFTSALILAVGLLLPVALAVIKNPRSILRADNLLATSPIYWLLLDLLQGRYEMDAPQREYVTTSFTAIGVFCCGVWVSSLHKAIPLHRRLTVRGVNRLTVPQYFWLGVTCFALGIFYFAYKAGFSPAAMIQGLQGMRWDSPWARTSAEGGWEALIEHLQYFGMLLPALAVLVGRGAGWFNYRTVLLFYAALIMGAFLAQGGSRRYVGVMFGAALLVWLFTAVRVRWRTFSLLALWAALLLFVMEIMYIYRGEGITAFTEPEIEMVGVESALERIDSVRVDDNFLRLAQTIELVPARHPYVWYDYPLFALIRPIPRAIWPGKPLQPSFRVQDFVVIGASLSSAVVGELWVSGGLIAIFLGGWAFGLLGNGVTPLLAHRESGVHGLTYGVAIMALFAGQRSMQDLVMMSYILLAWIGILVVFRAVFGASLASEDADA